MKMKKLLILIAVCLLLCGCTQTDDGITADTAANTDTASTVTDTAVVTEAITDAPDGAPVIYTANKVTENGVRLYSGFDLPPLPEPVERYVLSYGDGEYSVGEGVLYTDNGAIVIPSEGTVRFELSLYQDSLDYTAPLLEVLNNSVTKDYDQKTYDRLAFAKEHISLTVNGEAASVTDVSRGKGNGHVDYYITAEVGDGFTADKLETLSIVIE